MSNINSNSDVYVNIFKHANQSLVAICDKELLGKTFRSGKLKLEVKENFYRGILKSIDEAINMLETADIANLAGNRIVTAAVKGGYADLEAIISIGGTAHLQIMKL